MTRYSITKRHLNIASVHVLAVMDLLADAKNQKEANLYQALGLIWDDLEKAKKQAGEK